MIDQDFANFLLKLIENFLCSYSQLGQCISFLRSDLWTVFVTLFWNLVITKLLLIYFTTAKFCKYADFCSKIPQMNRFLQQNSANIQIFVIGHYFMNNSKITAKFCKYADFCSKIPQMNRFLQQNSANIEIFAIFYHLMNTSGMHQLGPPDHIKMSKFSHFHIYCRFLLS